MNECGYCSHVTGLRVRAHTTDTSGRVVAALDPGPSSAASSAGCGCSRRPPRPRPPVRRWLLTARHCAAATIGPTAAPCFTWSEPGQAPWSGPGTARRGG